MRPKECEYLQAVNVGEEKIFFSDTAIGKMLMLL